MNEDQQETKVAVIGGITGSIGGATARILADDGWTIAGFARKEDRLRDLASGSAYHLFQADATDSGAVDEVFGKIRDKLGRIDAYVHAIGSILLKPAQSLTDEDWRQCLSVNLDSAFHTLRAGVRVMLKNGGGSLAYVSTAAARTGLPNHEAVAAAKAGLEGLVRSAAASYANKGIRVNAAAPGMVETNLSASFLANDASRRISEAMHPTGRVGRPGDIARVLAFLVNPSNDWITGQVWAVDGGMAHLRQRVKG